MGDCNGWRHKLADGGPLAPRPTRGLSLYDLIVLAQKGAPEYPTGVPQSKGSPEENGGPFIFKQWLSEDS